MNKIRLFFVIPFVVLLFNSCKNDAEISISTQETTSSIFLVRHAEKADDGTKDPPLTAMGEARALKLSELLKDEGINHVFSSDYKRTRLTAGPTAAMIETKIQLYNPRDMEGFTKMLSELEGQNILVVGHSNSTPTLANTIMGDEIFTNYEETEYSNIIEIIRKKNSKSAVFSNMD